MGETPEETNPRKAEQNGEKEKLPAKLTVEEEEVTVVKPKKDEPKNKKPPHFVLVHGFSHGAWCWYKIRCLMENSGYRVSCIDLKGAGIDQTDPNTIFSLHDYNQTLLDFLSALPDDEQVIFLLIKMISAANLIFLKLRAGVNNILYCYDVAGNFGRSQRRRS